MKKRAFTLAEIMIVLTVIGILTAIILPSAKNLMPDRNLMKFKKAHNMLGTVVAELVNSDKYYLNGDFSTKPNGDLIDGTHDGDKEYLCETIADVINAKKVDCKDMQVGTGYFGESSIASINANYTIQIAGTDMDNECNTAQSVVGDEIVTSDNVSLFDCNPAASFGISRQNFVVSQGIGEYASDPDQVYFKRKIKNSGGEDAPDAEFYQIYKVFCMDIDGVNKGEAPFGYGIRVDGKFVAGARATEWLKKDIQND